MKTRFTEAALSDIHEIREFLLLNYPSVAPLVEQRIRMSPRVSALGRKAHRAQSATPASASLRWVGIRTGSSMR